MKSCNCSCRTFLISVCNSSTVRSATFMMISLMTTMVTPMISIISMGIRAEKTAYRGTRVGWNHGRVPPYAKRSTIPDVFTTIGPMVRTSDCVSVQGLRIALRLNGNKRITKTNEFIIRGTLMAIVSKGITK